MCSKSKPVQVRRQCARSQEQTPRGLVSRRARRAASCERASRTKRSSDAALLQEEEETAAHPAQLLQ